MTTNRKLNLIAEGIEAFRFTREYVGEDLLPEVPGWSWYDWVTKARAEVEGEVTTNRKLNALAAAVVLAVVSAAWVGIGVVVGWAVWG